MTTARLIEQYFIHGVFDGHTMLTRPAREYEVSEAGSGEQHLIPSEPFDGGLYFTAEGHEVARECPCEPEFACGVWVHREMTWN